MLAWPALPSSRLAPCSSSPLPLSLFSFPGEADRPAIIPDVCTFPELPSERAASRPGSKLDSESEVQMLEVEMSAKKRERMKFKAFLHFTSTGSPPSFVAQLDPFKLTTTCFSSYYVKESAIPAVRHTEALAAPAPSVKVVPMKRSDRNSHKRTKASGANCDDVREAEDGGDAPPVNEYSSGNAIRKLISRMQTIARIAHG